MSDRHLLLASPVIVAWLVLAQAAAAVDLAGRAAVGGGGLEHPLGVAEEPSSPYVTGDVDLRVVLGDTTQWRLTYAGSGTRFDPDVPLDYLRQAFGVEWLRLRPRDRWTVSAGLQGEVRRQADVYRIYDHDGAYGYVAFKTYPDPRVMLRGWVGIRLRTYRDLPEESCVEPHAVLEVKRFGDDRTTLGAALRLGGKWFHDPVAPKVWGTAGTPVTSQVTVSLDAARGVADRVGVRAGVDLSLGLRGFPYYVAEDLYDSPLLDRYAHTGPAAVAAVKWLTPLAAWLELGVGVAGNDYGEILFADGAGGGSTRRDDVVDIFASCERPFLTRGTGMVVRGAVSWRDQSSSLAAYTWTGLQFTAGAEWRF